MCRFGVGWAARPPPAGDGVRRTGPEWVPVPGGWRWRWASGRRRLRVADRHGAEPFDGPQARTAGPTVPGALMGRCLAGAAEEQPTYGDRPARAGKSGGTDTTTRV